MTKAYKEPVLITISVQTDEKTAPFRDRTDLRKDIQKSADDILEIWANKTTRNAPTEDLIVESIYGVGKPLALLRVGQTTVWNI